jgi:hypothetical protein
MKVINSEVLSAFGGLNFVIKELDKLKIGTLLNTQLPDFGPQSKYSWRDIFYSYWSVFFCGGDCAEDLSGNFRPGLLQIPFLKVPSPDRVLERLKELASPAVLFRTKRSQVDHHFAINGQLSGLNLLILQKLFKLSDNTVVVDYDNTLCFTEKQDALRTYKKELGYAPGVGFIGSKVIYVENRNGNNNASTLQDETLERMFEQLSSQGIHVGQFRADSASFTFKAIQVIDRHSDKFYIKARMSEKLVEIISSVTKWQPVVNKDGEIYRGETLGVPFVRTAKRAKALELLKEYRFVVTKEKRRDKQVNAFTGEAYNYSVIVTSDRDSSLEEIVNFYNQRGAIEKEFDVLKNDFGWKKMPFSKLEQNLVFLQITAMCRNIYHYIIHLFSSRYKGLCPTYRIKKFIFRFVTVPAKWIYHARQWHLKVYGKIAFKT